MNKILILFLTLIYLSSVVGYGVHTCLLEKDVYVVSLISSSASCSDIHSEKDGSNHHCKGCKHIESSNTLNENNAFTTSYGSNSITILEHNDDCCISDVYKLDISEKSSTHKNLKAYNCIVSNILSYTDILLKNSLNNTKNDRFLLKVPIGENNIFKVICSYLI